MEGHLNFFSYLRYKCTDVSCPPGYRVEHGQNHRFKFLKQTLIKLYQHLMNNILALIVFQYFFRCKRESTRCRSNDIACLKKEN